MSVLALFGVGAEVRDEGEVVHECRRCGTNTDAGGSCPACGHGDIVRFEI